MHGVEPREASAVGWTPCAKLPPRAPVEAHYRRARAHLCLPPTPPATGGSDRQVRSRRILSRNGDARDPRLFVICGFTCCAGSSGAFLGHENLLLLIEGLYSKFRNTILSQMSPSFKTSSAPPPARSRRPRSEGSLLKATHPPSPLTSESHKPPPNVQPSLPVSMHRRCSQLLGNGPNPTVGWLEPTGPLTWGRRANARAGPGARRTRRAEPLHAAAGGPQSTARVTDTLSYRCRRPSRVESAHSGR